MVVNTLKFIPYKLDPISIEDEDTQVKIANKQCKRLITTLAYCDRFLSFLDYHKLYARYFRELGPKDSKRYFRTTTPDRWISDMFIWGKGDRSFWADVHTEWLNAIHYYSNNPLLRAVVVANMPLERVAHYTGANLSEITRWLESTERPLASTIEDIKLCLLWDYEYFPNPTELIRRIQIYYSSIDILNGALEDESYYRKRKKESRRQAPKWIERAVEQITI